ncbi:unnamed protein product [Peronospora destructor]|nr:unnamed protein product [Peronospora destructor]
MKDESVREFNTRWEMLMQQYASSMGIEMTDGLTCTALPKRSAAKSAGPGVEPFAKPPQNVGNESADDQRKIKPESRPAEEIAEKPVQHRTTEASVTAETAAMPRKAAPLRVDATRRERDTVDLTHGDASAATS